MNNQILKKFKAQNLEVAKVYFLDYLVKKKEYKIEQVFPRNRNRYIIIKGTLKNKTYPIALIFKHEIYYTFGNKFAHKGESGAGESVNLNFLRECLKKEVKEIYVVYEDRKYYSITPEMWLFHGYKHSLNFEKGSEVCSISLRHLNRLNPEERFTKKVLQTNKIGLGEELKVEEVNI